ncbi:MAG: hypothetical protein K5756_00295 [Clostridiales bacterium]|nr:hypothetical protein [Clostridiales bacterium]
MSLYRIANLLVDIEYKYKDFSGRYVQYAAEEDGTPAFKVLATDKEIEELRRKAPNLDIDSCEYLILGSNFYEHLLDHDGMMLHSSAVALDGEAYVFSASPGVGKSTHTQLWQEYFGKERTFIVNDDKPAIRFVDGKAYAYGTPFSGKFDISENVGVPIKAISFIYQSPDNKIEPMPQSKAIASILNQTIRPANINGMDKVLNAIEKIVATVPVYSLGCNISHDAVKLSYSVMSGKKII